MDEWKEYQEKFGGQAKTLKGSERPDISDSSGDETRRRPKRMKATDWGAPAGAEPTGPPDREASEDTPGRRRDRRTGKSAESRDLGGTLAVGVTAALAVPLALLRHKRMIFAVLVVVAASIAFGPVKATDLIGDFGDPIDAELKDAGDRITAGVANLSEGIAESVNNTTRASGSPADSEEFQKQTEDRTHVLINVKREEQGVQQLQYDERLAEIARQHSQRMAEEGYIYHSGPDGDLQDRLSAAGYQCRVRVSGNQYATGGENVAQTWYQENLVNGGYYDTSDELAAGLVRQWMESPGHRENILRPYWQNEGIGIAIVEENGKTAIYATQVFC